MTTAPTTKQIALVTTLLDEPEQTKNDKQQKKLIF